MSHLRIVASRRDLQSKFTLVEPEGDGEQGFHETGHPSVMFGVDGEQDDEDDQDSPPGGSVLPSFLTATTAVRLPAVRSLANPSETHVVISTTSFSPAKVSLSKKSKPATKARPIPPPAFSPLPPPAQKTRPVREATIVTKNGGTKTILIEMDSADDEDAVPAEPRAPAKQKQGSTVEFGEHAQAPSRPKPRPITSRPSSSQQASLEKPSDPRDVAVDDQDQSAPAPSKPTRAKKGSTKGKAKEKGGAPGEGPGEVFEEPGPGPEPPVKEAATRRQAASSKPAVTTRGAATRSSSRQKSGGGG